MDSIEIVVEADEAEVAGGIMWASGVAGIEERDEPDGRVRLIAGVVEEQSDDVAAALAVRWTVIRGRMEPELWVDSWRPYAKAARLSGGIVVQPPWIEPIAEPDDLIVSLDPGRAWGHGAHPSTLLAGEDLLACGDLAGRSVLDVGCGSGLLSLLAAIRNASRVVAVDIDPAAVEATLANAMVNGVGAMIDVSTTPVAIVDGPFDVIVANIGLPVLTELAPVLTGHLAAGGSLLLSGLLDDQVDAVLAAYRGLVEQRRSEREGWSSVVLKSEP